jgi:hypothetical protein
VCKSALKSDGLYISKKLIPALISINSDTNAQGINRKKNEAKSTFFTRTETLFSKNELVTFRGKSFIICFEICLEFARSA